MKDYTSRVVGMLMLVGMATITQAQPGGRGGPQVVSPANAPQGGDRQFEYERPLIASPMTFAHLLSHTSGLNA